MIRRSHILTTAALVAACVVPTYADAKVIQEHSTAAPASQSYQDLRSPDARDAGQPSQTQVAQDLRSPDARDAALAAQTQVAQDLRSPDARDAGRPESPPADTVVEIREAPGSGFDWGDAGIGAAGILAMLSIAGGLALMVTSRRRRRGTEMPAH